MIQKPSLQKSLFPRFSLRAISLFTLIAFLGTSFSSPATAQTPISSNVQGGTDTHLLASASATPASDDMRGVRLLTVVDDDHALEGTFKALGVFNTWAEHGRFTAEVPPELWKAVNASVSSRNWTVTRFVEDMQQQIDAENAARAVHPYPPRDAAQRRPIGGVLDAPRGRAERQRRARVLRRRVRRAPGGGPR